jgi:hypothetical protein
MPHPTDPTDADSIERLKDRLRAKLAKANRYATPWTSEQDSGSFWRGVAAGVRGALLSIGNMNRTTVNQTGPCMGKRRNK